MPNRTTLQREPIRLALRVSMAPATHGFGERPTGVGVVRRRLIQLAGRGTAPSPAASRDPWNLQHGRFRPVRALD